LKQLIIIQAFIFLCNNILFAQPFQFSHITAEDGLNVNSVNNFFKDSNGFLWFATSDGVCRYDGIDFKQYHHNTGKKNALLGPIYTSIIEDKEGDIWLQSEKGIECIEYKTGDLQVVHEFEKHFNTLTNGFIYLKQRNIIVNITYNGEFTIVNTQTNKVIDKYAAPEIFRDIKSTGKDLEIYAVSSVLPIQKKDESKLIFLAYDCSYWYEFDIITRKYDKFKLNLPNDAIISSELDYLSPSTIAFTIIKGKQLFFCEMDVATKKLKRIVQLPISKSVELITQQCNLVVDKKRNRIFIPVNHYGILVCDTNINVINILKHDPVQNGTVLGNTLFTKTTIIDDVFWVAPNPTGISYTEVKDNKFYNYSSNIGNADIVKGLFVDRKKNIYSCSFGIGMKYFNALTGQDITNTLPNHVRNFFSDVDYTAFNGTYMINEDEVLIRTIRNLFIYNHTNYTFKDYSKWVNKNIIASNGFRFNQAFLLPNKNLLLEAEKTMYTLELLPNNSCKIIAKDSFNFPISAIYQTSKGLRLVGTLQGVFIQQKGKYQFLTKTNGILIKNIVETKNGSIFIATTSGVFHLNEQGELLASYDSKNGLTNNFCYGLLEDELGNIWISNNAGLTKFNPKTKQFQYYTKADGVQDNEFNSNAFNKGFDGMLYFGGMKGVSAFNPFYFTTTTTFTKPKLTGLAFDNVWINPDTPFWNIPKWTTHHNHNDITLKFSSMDLTHAAALEFLYKLEGVDKDWLQTSTNIVRYQNLAPGTYTFLIKLKKNELSSEPTELVTIIVKPAFYQTGWFYALLVFGAAFIMWQTIQTINKRKYQKKLQALKLQEELETERQRISRDLHDNMGAYTSALIANVQQLKSKAGDNSDLQKMQTNAEQILSSLRETIWVLNNKEISVQEFSDGFKNYCFKLLKNFEHISFDADENITDNYMLPASKAIHLNKIMQEIIQNIIKHANATIIKYEFSTYNGLYIKITDNGNGFDDSVDSKGYGIDNMKWRAKEAGVEIGIQSQSGKGCSIVLKNTLK
jgi:signal transduction histidine kinase